MVWSFLGKPLEPLRLLFKGLIAPTCIGAFGLAERNGRIVLVRQSYNRGWHLPGGGVKRGEPPAEACLRELGEEIGLTASAPPELFGIYVRTVGVVTNHVVVFRVRDAEFLFKPNLEIREIALVPPDALPAGVGGGAGRRIAEAYGGKPQSRYW
jgi:8-oxo-dGTP pyrophosphatase MutT (NUDIX family)